MKWKLGSILNDHTMSVLLSKQGYREHIDLKFLNFEETKFHLARIVFILKNYIEAGRLESGDLQQTHEQVALPLTQRSVYNHPFPRNAYPHLLAESIQSKKKMIHGQNTREHEYPIASIMYEEISKVIFSRRLDSMKEKLRAILNNPARRALLNQLGYRDHVDIKCLDLEATKYQLVKISSILKHYLDAKERVCKGTKRSQEVHSIVSSFVNNNGDVKNSIFSSLSSRPLSHIDVEPEHYLFSDWNR